MPMKLHFTSLKFDVFSCPRLKNTSINNYESRKDKYIFERLSKKFNEPRECVRYYAANFSYGNLNFLYDPGLGQDNYILFNRRRQSITNLFSQDLEFISDNVLNRLATPRELFNFYINKEISHETLVIMNTFDNIIDELINSDMNLVWEDNLLRLKKSERFIKFDKDKIANIYYENYSN